MPKKLTWWWLPLSLSPLFLVGACAANTNQTATAPTLDLNTSYPQTNTINAFKPTAFKIVDSDVPRIPNNQVYQDTLMYQRYGTTFRYPGYDYNYKASENKFQMINGNSVESARVLLEETVQYTDEQAAVQTVHYSDPGFILNEIKHHRLKQHPAAAKWHRHGVNAQTKVVNKWFSLPSLPGPTALGLYAPPGEVITLQFSPATLAQLQAQKINDFKLVINSSYWDNAQPGDSGQISDRYPYLETRFNVDLATLVKNNGVFQFGTPFGGTISAEINSRLKSANSSTFYQTDANFEFNIIGAAEMLTYVHGVTTKAAWDLQVRRVLNDEIVAPALALDFAFGSMNIPATARHTFAYQPLTTIKYPGPLMEKWTNFLTISNLFNARDLKGNFRKLNFQFNDDVWGGAVGWGGGDRFSTGLEQARSSFFGGPWTINTNWLAFHEINHNYEQNTALFKRQSHPATNQVSMTALSLLSDSGRWRNIFNPSGEFSSAGWSRMQNIYSTIKHIGDWNYTNPSNDSEYELQNILVNTFGTYNFLDYVRYDAMHEPNTVPGWTGFKEIVELSDFFKVNLWPTMRNFAPWWNDGWPQADELATAEEQAEIRRLNQTYSAIDFVGNAYAAGAYLYNSTTGKYDYTNDTQAPIDIAPNRPYTLYLEQGINSTNRNFAWDKLNFRATTKLGGQLALAPDNPKNLVYTPPANALGQTDEFDLSISPSAFANKPTNYVKEYIWKIKFRLVGNLPVVSLYKSPQAEHPDANFFKDFAYMRDENNVEFATTSDPRLGFGANQNLLTTTQRAKIAFKFIAPRRGRYSFQARTNSFFFIINKNHDPDTPVFQTATAPTPTQWLDTNYALDLAAGTVVNFEIYTTTQWNHSFFDLQAIVDDDHTNPVNLFDYATIPDAQTITSDPKSLLDARYDYQWRSIDFNQINTSIYGLAAARPSEQIEPTTYQFSSTTLPASIDINQKLKQVDNDWLEDWGANPYTLDLDVHFVAPTPVQTILFHHRTDNHYEARPETILVQDQAGQILYQGAYGKQFNDRGASYAKLELTRPTAVTALKFHFQNTQMNSIIFDALEFFPTKALPVNKVISAIDPAVKAYGNDWQVLPNDVDVNLSAFNGAALVSTKANQYLAFDLVAQGFDIVGPIHSDASKFELFVNGVSLGVFDPTSDFRVDNAILARYTTADYATQLLQVKIVALEDRPLIINGLQTYGPRVTIN